MRIVVRRKRKKKTGDRRRGGASSVRRRIFLVFLGTCLTAALLGIAGNIFRTPPPPPQIPAKPLPKPTRPKPKPLRIAKPPQNTPCIAIIIDDIGYDLDKVDELLAIDGALTFSILPDTPYAVAAARKISESGREILLHLPMEPVDTQRWKPGPNALLESMNEEQIRATLLKDISAVPGIAGVNNHMGSRFTVDERRMKVVIEILREKGLFFIDSRTAPDSIAYSLARRMGLKSAASDLFLDHIDSEEYVSKQWEACLKIARSRGRAIAIGHPHDATYRVLRKEIPRLSATGITLIPVSMILEYP